MPSIIRPTDFTEHSSSNHTLGAWDPSTLKRLVPFLIGERVIVVTNNDSGQAVEGFITGIVAETLTSPYPHITMSDDPDDDSLQRLHRVSDLGEIMILSDSNARWYASIAMRNERSEALNAVREHIGTDFPEKSPAKGPRRFDLDLTWNGVRVSWGQSIRDERWLVTPGDVTRYA